MDLLKSANIYYDEAHRRKPLFIGVFLTEDGRHSLLDWWKEVVRLPFLEKVFANQMITHVHPSMEQVEQVQEGREVSIRITGWAANMQGQVVTGEPTESIGMIEHFGAYPFITVSSSLGVPRLYLERLAAGFFKYEPGPVLPAQLGVKWAPGF